MVSKWKQEALQQMAEGFNKRNVSYSEHSGEEIKTLHAKIGQLTVERDFFPRCLQETRPRRLKEMVIPHHAQLSIRKQCKVLGLNRSSYYQGFPEETTEILSLMKQIDRLYLSYPSYESRRIKQVLTHEG